MKPWSCIDAIQKGSAPASPTAPAKVRARVWKRCTSDHECLPAFVSGTARRIIQSNQPRGDVLAQIRPRPHVHFLLRLWS